MKSILYVITNLSMPGICKVGVTNNLEKRLEQLNKTSTPTRFQVYAKFDLKNAEVMEQEVFQHFSKQRVNRKREFFEIHPERVCDFIFDNKNIVKEKDLKDLGKFEKIGIKEGEILRFKEGDDIYKYIVVTVGKGNSVFYKNKKTSLSKSALDVLNSSKFQKNWKSAQGSIFWTYKGKTVRDIMDENNL